MKTLSGDINIIHCNGYYELEKDGVKMSCDPGELRDSILEFNSYYEEKKQIAWQ